jgi:hypothetical protein
MSSLLNIQRESESYSELVHYDILYLTAANWIWFLVILNTIRSAGGDNVRSRPPPFPS